MFRYILLIIFIILHDEAHSSHDDTDFYLAGADIADDGQFPYHVSIQDKDGKHYCGGSIVNERSVLTAGSCVTRRDPEDYSVVTGTNGLNESKMRYEVEVSFIPEVRDRFREVGEVAVIIVKQNIKFGPKVRPVKLSTDFVDDNELLLVSGFGTTMRPDNTTNINGSNELRYLHQRSLSLDECQNLYPDLKKTSENVLCTLPPIGTGVCMYDGGSPLVRADTHEQVGITVGTASGCKGESPDMYMRITVYYDWIMSNIVNVTPGNNINNSGRNRNKRKPGSINFHDTFFINTTISL